MVYGDYTAFLERVGDTSGVNYWLAQIQNGSTLPAVAASFIGSSEYATLASQRTLTSIAVTPTNKSIASGTTQQFSAIGTFKDNSTQDLTSQVTWASDTPATATINAKGLATGVSTGSSVISATLGKVTGSTPLSVSNAKLTSIAITPVNQTIAIGTTQQFSAIGTFNDDSTQDLTSQVTWASGTPAVATIVPTTGVATGVSVGGSTISASFGGVTVSTGLAVSPATLSSIAVTPATPTIASGTTQQFTATGTYSDGSTQDLTSQVTWASDTPAKATIVSTTGVATGVSTGSSTISASFNGFTGSTKLTVSSATLTSIAVTPATPTIAMETSQQFTATGIFSDGSTQDLTSQVTWASGTPAVATIVPTTGVATGVSVGSSTISASFGGVTVSTTLTVSNATLSSIAIAPVNPIIAKGTTLQFSAIGSFSDGSTQDLTSQVTWASGTPAKATINAKGLATGVSQGSSAISINFGGLTSSTLLTVSNATLSSIAIAPPNQTIVRGTTQQFSASGTFNDGSTQDLTSQVTWASGTPAVATINAKGLATGVSTGSSAISAKFGGKTGLTSLNVSP